MYGMLSEDGVMYSYSPADRGPRGSLRLATATITNASVLRALGLQAGG
jgi:hypothetical protein